MKKLFNSVKLFICTAFLFIPPFSLASERPAHLLGVGQGISSPSVTSVINFSSGFTSESPIGLIYQDGFRITGQYEKNGSDTFGGELAYGGRGWGIGAGYRKSDCDNCEGDGVAALGVSIGNALGLGIRFEEGLYAVGMMLNPTGQHRLGLMTELNDPEGEENNISSFGVGYSYMTPQVTLTVDASKRDYENELINDDVILLSPGISIRADVLQVSVNYRMYLNEGDISSNAFDDGAWFGVGFGDRTYHIAVYSDYVSDLALNGSWFF